MIYRINSRSNQKVKDLIKQRDHYFFFEGEKLVKDILQKGKKVEVLVIHKAKEKQLHVTRESVKETWYVSESVLKKISSLKEKPDFIAVLKLKEEEINFRKSKVVIGVDNIQDPANAGTIFRCAAAFGIDAVVFSGASVKPNNPKFLRAAQDAFFDIHFQHFETIEMLIAKAKKANFNIYLTSSHESRETVGPEEVQFPCLLLFGNEGTGLAEALFQEYASIKIAQTNKVESLNVGVSACIIMHELRKRAMKP
jgi:TrmH family RNA methyltransferase